jgi:hypothetical protein
VRPTGMPRSYWSKEVSGERLVIIVKRGDEAMRRRLKRRGWTKLRVDQMQKSYYLTLVRLVPGTYHLPVNDDGSYTPKRLTDWSRNTIEKPGIITEYRR